MPSQILEEFRESSGFINMNELSYRLGVEKSALDGMLELLVRQGKLREVCTTGSSGCYHCGSSCHGCGYTHGDAVGGRSYDLVSPNLRDEGIK